jgi:4-diphosphocytidyl-2-C-methyl-D-erythritol kinase
MVPSGQIASRAAKAPSRRALKYSSFTMKAVICAPAKINLTLEVLARRSDGYHGIRSVMVPLELADELTIEPSETFEFTCNRSELAEEGNLVVRALRSLDTPPCKVHLHKRIPLQAGLGGGSSDAAAVLRAAMAGALGRRIEADWLATARSLGSDVPFFLAGTGALVEGTGERVTPLGALPAWHALILMPPVAVSTAVAFAKLDRAPRPSRPRAESVSISMVGALQRCEFAAVRALLQNDFTSPIAEATLEIAAAQNALRKAGATNVSLSGSGSSVFTLATSAAEIAQIEGKLDLSPEYQRFPTAFGSSDGWQP